MTPPRRIARPALTYVITAVAVIVVWWVTVRATGVKAYLLPPPDLIIMKMWAERASLLKEGAVTAWATVLGFLLSVAVGIPLAMAMTQSRRAYDVGYPLLVGLQTLPKIAVAPLLVVAFGFGLVPKIILVVLVAFFPVVINAIAGFRSVDEDLRNLRADSRLQPNRILLAHRPTARAACDLCRTEGSDDPRSDRCGRGGICRLRQRAWLSALVRFRISQLAVVVFGADRADPARLVLVRGGCAP